MAEIHQVLWSLAVHAAEHHDAQLVGDSLRYIKPVQLSVQEPQQATLKLGCTADHSSCDVQHSLQLVRRYFRCAELDKVTQDSRQFVHNFYTG